MNDANVFAGSSYLTRDAMLRAIAETWLFADGSNNDEFVAAQNAEQNADECAGAWCLPAGVNAAELLDAFEAVIAEADARNEAAVEAARLEAIEDAVMGYPGSARQVYGGWIWMLPGGEEQAWSKAATRAACHEKVYEVVEYRGIADAFDLSPAENRIASLLAGWNRADVAAHATASDFADAFLSSETFDEDISLELADWMARVHWAYAVEEG